MYEVTANPATPIKKKNEEDVPKTNKRKTTQIFLHHLRYKHNATIMSL
jgi:hypothetical protein